jgi:hypothetical protein
MSPPVRRRRRVRAGRTNEHAATQPEHARV